MTDPTTPADAGPIKTPVKIKDGCGELAMYDVDGNFVTGFPLGDYAYAAQIADALNAPPRHALVDALEQVKQACLFDVDDYLGGIGVTRNPHIPDDLFARICSVLATESDG